MGMVSELADSITWPNIRSMHHLFLPPNIRRPLMRWTATALLSQTLVAGAVPMGDLPTLFYTPLERQAISAGRLPASAVGDMAEPASTTQLNGIVRRAAGKGTVWVNDKPVPEGTSPAGRIQALGAVVDGRRMLVGESVDLISGARTDVVAPGAVRLQNKP